jgi:hypothetical protein
MGMSGAQASGESQGSGGRVSSSSLHGSCPLGTYCVAQGRTYACTLDDPNSSGFKPGHCRRNVSDHSSTSRRGGDAAAMNEIRAEIVSPVSEASLS